MSALGKTDKGFRKRPVEGDLLVTPKTLLFAHQFSSDSDTLDLSALVAPTDPEFAGWSNPTSAEISRAHLNNKKAKLYLQYVGRPARLLPTVSYDVSGDMSVTLKNGAEALAGEIIVGWIDTYVGNAKAIDGYSIVKTGTLTAGQTDVTTSLPFNYNKYSDQQVGDVLFFLEGQLIFRCEGNSDLNDGEYTEVSPSLGGLTNTLRLKQAVVEDTSYVVVSNGLVAFAPTETLLDYIRTLAGQIDILVADMVGVTGNPPSRYQSAPNETDLSVFGQRVYAFTSETLYNFVVGSSSQVSSGKATHSSLAAVLAVAPANSRILVLETYSTVEDITPITACVVEGKSYGAVINGNLTISIPNFVIRDFTVTGNLALNSTYSQVDRLKITGTTGITGDYNTIRSSRFGDNVTFAVGADANFVRECFLASGKTVTDNGILNQKLIIEEA